MNDLYNGYLTETRRIEKLGEREYRRSIEGKDDPDTSVYDSLAQVYTEYKVKFQLDNIHNIVGRTVFVNEIGSVYDPHFLETYPTLPEEVKADKKYNGTMSFAWIWTGNRRNWMPRLVRR